MKKIIISPDGREFVFDFNQFQEFEHILFAVLCGAPKKVEIITDDFAPYNITYKVCFI